VITVVASRGWEQWALHGFAVGYRPVSQASQAGTLVLAAVAILSLALASREGRRSSWPALRESAKRAYRGLSQRQQLALTAATAALVTVTGWLTWGQQVAGLYRRLGDGTQLALTAAAASVFYVAPSFLVYGAALALLFLLIYLRPFWGLSLIAFAMPFYVLPKPMLGYRFSPVELFTMVTLAATVLAWLSVPGALSRPWSRRGRLPRADYAVLAFTLVATLSLLFTERLDVASNEWRVVILEPALFYFMLRRAALSEREMWSVLDSFVLGGLVVALYGLGQYVIGEGLITAEAGLMRLRSFYGSPNNVGLYLGRVFPLLAAMALVGTAENGRRRGIYGLLMLPIGLAILLSFSKGALFLGIPAATVAILWRWRQNVGRSPWPWLAGFIAVAAAGILLAAQVPQLAGRLDLAGATGFFRVNLWRASLNMIADHPWFGVGLDNFLYAYRGRYIFDAAWREPNLSHPHNLLLDFGTRLGLFGLVSGGWMIWQLLTLLRRVTNGIDLAWTPLVVGLGGALADMLGHGFVDHAFFLVDLAFAFYLMLAAAVWLHQGADGRRQCASDP
jgi:O-antigen ligase